MQYFIKRGEKVQGPFSREQLLGFAKAKKVTGSDLVATDELGPFEELKSTWDSITGTKTTAKAENPNFNSCSSCGAPVFENATTCPKCASPIG